MVKKGWLNWLKSKIPRDEVLKEHRFLRFFGSYLLAGYLWHFHRRNVVKGIAIGIFCCNLPMPFQMIPAAALAIFFRAHLPVSVACVWISNPITMPFLMVAQYHVGAFILRSPDLVQTFEASFDWFKTHFAAIWQPLLLGAVIFACVTSALSYFIAKTLWERRIWHKWMNRKARR